MIIPTPMLSSFIIYFIILMGTGLYFFRRSHNIEDYLLGGRVLGKWVTAFSAQASDMSGWLLMGLPGVMYLSGLPAALIAVGLFVGTILNWKFVSPRLRLYTEKVNALTLPSFFEDRFRDPTGLLRFVSAIIILIFFTIYASSGLVAAGKLFESIFDIDYRIAASIGVLVIVLYTFLGGFLAVSWTDLFQGILMVIAITIVPAVTYYSAGGIDNIQKAMYERGLGIHLLPRGEFSFLAIISTLSWGLGYFGQPHILARFMGIKSNRELSGATIIATIWVFLSLTGAIMVGILAIPMFPELPKGDEEKVFIYMINCIFNPWIGGIMLAGILSAIMSTIDSQLLVSSSVLTEDFYQNVIKRDATQKELIYVGRLCVIIISVIALLLALNPNNTVLGLVAYAWGGFGAAFGPIILYSLFSRRVSWQAALTGMISGTVVLILWKEMGLGKILYEIVPGFLTNTIVILLFNCILPAEDEEIEREFQEIVTQVRGIG